MQSLKCQIEEEETFCDLLLALLLIQPHILWLSSILITCIQISDILFCKSAPSQLPACTVTWECSVLAWDWAFPFVELRGFPTDPYLQLIHIPLMNCSSASQTGKLHSLQTREYTPPLSLLVCKDTEHYGLYFQCLVRWHWCLPVRWPLHAWSQTFKPKCLANSPAALFSTYFLERVLWEACRLLSIEPVVSSCQQSSQLNTNRPC